MREILSDLEDGGNADPMGAAQAAMRPAKVKRFYKTVSVAQEEGGYVVHLDGKPVRTPGRIVIAVGTAAAAQLLADEFSAQGEFLDAMTMPCFRLLNSAIDGVATEQQAVLEDIIRFAGTDLLCYRAEGPDGLVAEQSSHWDDPLSCVERETGARFVLAEGVMHVAQPKAVISAFGALVKQVSNPIELAALHAMTTLTGSAVLAFNVYRGEMGAEAAWTAAHVDEDWNIAQWGEDGEAKERRAARWLEMSAAAQMLEALSDAKAENG